VVVVSNEDYKKLPVEYRIILPAINPISEKNRELTDEQIAKILFNYDIPTDKPLVTQISRFDKWKDPEGVIDTFLKVKEKVDCRLVLCGSMASDDPEGITIYENIKDKVKDLIEKKDVILLTVMDDLLVNALQRVASVVVQKSHREGFGLTVTEALWKGTPVVASNIGGIVLQVKNDENGFLLEPKDNDGFAEKIVEILKNPLIKEQLGLNAKKTVKDNFLITRLLNDYIDLLNDILH